MDRHSLLPSSSKLSSVLSRALPRRIRRRRENATFGGFPSPLAEEASASSPSRELSKTTLCCTPEPIPRSDSSASTASTASSSRSRESFSVSSTCSSPRFSSSSSVVSTPLPQNLRVQGWMYWARPDEALLASGVQRRRSDPVNGECFMKVFGVLRNEFLLLYKSDHNSALFSASAETPLVQIAVARATLLPTRSFLVEDPHGHEMELYLFDRQDQRTLDRWEEALDQAAELTESHFSSFDVKVEQLSRSSMYRGSLHDLRQRTQRPSLRQSFRHKMTRLSSFGRLSSASSTAGFEPEREVSL